MDNYKVITMFYTLKDANSKEILESNKNLDPISFITNKNQVLKALEDKLINLKAGDLENIIISSGEGIGDYDSSLIRSIPKEEFAGIDLKVGMELLGESEDGESARVIVKEIKDNEVVVDFNHPYAGKDLEFDVEILDVRNASEEEISIGIPKTHSCKCKEHSHEEEHQCCGGGNCHHN